MFVVTVTDSLGGVAGQVEMTIAWDLVGDFDGDGSVVFGDFLLFAQVFGTKAGEEGYNGMCDLDGDGKKEMVAAAKDTGLWLLRPGADPRAEWSVSLIDSKSKGFEHAAVLADLDGDGTDELYAASDDDRELRRYVWEGGRPVREAIYARPDTTPILTWNLMPVPEALVP